MTKTIEQYREFLKDMRSEMCTDHYPSDFEPCDFVEIYDRKITEFLKEDEDEK